MSQLRQNTKFTLANYTRLFLAKLRLGSCGKNIHLDKNIQFMRNPQNIFLRDNVLIKEGTKICPCNSNAIIRIGKNTTIGYHNYIFSSNEIIIGSNCMIAPFVYIVDSDHNTKRNQLMNEQENITRPINIGDDVWIASNVTILKGVVIGNGAVIATNSVVNKNVPAFQIYGGTPAKKIGERV